MDTKLPDISMFHACVPNFGRPKLGTRFEMIHFVLNLCWIVSLHPRASCEIPCYPILEVVLLLSNKTCGFSSELGYTYVT